MMNKNICLNDTRRILEMTKKNDDYCARKAGT